jgi:integrase
MTEPKITGLKSYTSKGEVYVYDRASGVRILAPLGTAAFKEELRVVREAAAGRPAAIAGTFGAAVLIYREHHRWTDLAPRTKADYDKVLAYLAPLERMPLIQIDRAFIAGLRDKTYAKRKRRFANYVVAVMSAVFSIAAERGLMKDNPAKGVRLIPRPKNAAKANRAWTEGERDAVIDAASNVLRPVIAIGMYAGLRQGDVLRLPRNAVKDGWLALKTGKAGVEIAWPVHRELAAILEAAPKHDAITLLASSRGRPWTEDGFRSSFFRLINRLETEELIGAGLTFHGLRHTVGKLLKEDGASDEDIAIALGQKTTAMARHYSAEADTRTRMTASTVRFDPRKKAAARGV